jgi:ABC-type transporter Mla maintaining outer membrane lipid asymmetry ATPase subunit MlaF
MALMSQPAPAAPSPQTVDHGNCLVIRDLTVAYQRKVVLKGVQADIKRGQVIGVIGPNGGRGAVAHGVRASA